MIAKKPSSADGKDLSYRGFLPTRETSSFIITGEDVEKKKAVIRMFEKGHWFYSVNIASGRYRGARGTPTPCRAVAQDAPREVAGKDADEQTTIAAETELSDGSIVNVFQRCALYMIRSQARQLDKTILKEALQKGRIKS